MDMLVQLNPEVYGKYVVFENGRKVVYVVVLKAIYGMFIASLLWYKKFEKILRKRDLCSTLMTHVWQIEL